MKETKQQRIPAGTDDLKRLAESLDLPVFEESQLKAKVMKAVLETGQERAVISNTPAYKPRIWMPRFAFAAIAGVAILGGSVAVSANSLPGDRLYPVKQVKEQFELRLAPQGQPKAMVLAKHAEARLQELSDLKKSPAEEIAKHQQEIRSQANTQVHSAVESLNQVRQELEGKGKTEAVAAVDEALSRLVANAKKAELELEEKVGSAEKKEGENKAREKEGGDDKRPEGEVKGRIHRPETTDSKTRRKQAEGVVVVPKIITPTSTATSTAPLLPNDSPNGAVLGTSTQSGDSSINAPEKTDEPELSEEQKQAQEKLLEQQKQAEEKVQPEEHE